MVTMNPRNPLGELSGMVRVLRAMESSIQELSAQSADRMTRVHLSAATSSLIPAREHLEKVLQALRQ